MGAVAEQLLAGIRDFFDQYKYYPKPSQSFLLFGSDYCNNKNFRSQVTLTAGGACSLAKIKAFLLPNNRRHINQQGIIENEEKKEL